MSRLHSLSRTALVFCYPLCHHITAIILASLRYQKWPFLEFGNRRLLLKGRRNKLLLPRRASPPILRRASYD